MVVLPPYIPLGFFDLPGPVVFLAGPIQGAPTWHQKAVKKIRELSHEVVIVCPKTKIYPSEHNELAWKATSGYSAVMTEYPQYDWETLMLNHTAKSDGVILFWLAKEEQHFCNRAYGQTTRWELAEWKERHIRNKTKISVGIQNGWTGERYMRHRLSQDCPDITVHRSLTGTVKDALNQLGIRKGH